MLQVGSTGATGLGSFIAEADLPYEAEIIYFREGRAVSVDYVSFRGLGNDFQIERRTLEPQSAPPRLETSPAPSPTGTAGSPTASPAPPPGGVPATPTPSR